MSLWAEVEGRVAHVAAELAALGTELREVARRPTLLIKKPLYTEPS